MEGQDLGSRIALEVLIWLASAPEEMGAFLAATGADPSQLGARTGDPALHRAILDFLLQEDARVLAFSRASGHAPDVPLRARMAMGDMVHWT